MQLALQAPLPALRDDLSLLKGAPTLNGEPRWLIYDPVRHRYFEINGPAFELVSVWHEERDQVCAMAAARFRRTVSDGEIDAVKTFLLSNNLTVLPLSGQSSDYHRQSQIGRRGLVSRVLHGYLFFRIPLIRPQRALVTLYPFAAAFMTRWFLFLTLLAGAAGLYLVSRQWDAFIGSFPSFYSAEGIALFAISLVLIKILHELGHAFVAVRFGVRVPTIGLAFMVLFPVLYSDVTDAWRLRSRRQRLAIAAAGICVELAIAAYATLLWAILPEGAAKDIAFVLATSSWILSLFINLNPLMRFDGYYLLMDYWGISNLQSRSFAIARWWLREVMFGLGHPAPDEFTAAQRGRLVVYAIATWIYRFFLFLGIALAVYYMFFKALGVFLFVVEILYFILFPVFRELEAWWLMRREIVKTRRTVWTASIAAALVALFVVPWAGTVAVPAVLEAGQRADIYAPDAAHVETLHVSAGMLVREGDVIVTLGSRALEHRLDVAQKRQALAQQRIARAAGGNRELLNLRVLEQQLQSANEEINGLQREFDKLTVRAPMAGRVVDVSPYVHAGRWVDRNVALARIVSPEGARVSGLIGEDSLARIAEGNTGTFLPDDIYRTKIPVRLAKIATVGERKIDRPYFVSTFGGRITAEQDRDGTLLAARGYHQVQFSVDAMSPAEVVRGVVRLRAQPESLATAVWRNVLRVLVREASV